MGTGSVSLRYSIEVERLRSKDFNEKCCCEETGGRGVWFGKDGGSIGRFV